MTPKQILLGSAAITLALNFGPAEAQTSSKTQEIKQAPASPQVDKADGNFSKDAHKSTEPSRSDTTKSGAMSGSDRRAQESSKSDAAKSTAGGNPSDKAAVSKSGNAAKDAANDSNKNADRKLLDSKASDMSAGSDSARTPQNGTASKAEGKSASEAKSDSGQSRGDTNRATAATPAISKQQETRISAAISSTKIEPVAKVDFSVSIGTAVPGHVHLHPLPPTIVSIVPEYRGYEFFVVREEIVIVEPRTKKIVKVIEYSGPSHASTTSSRSQKMKLSDKDRATLRKSARTRQSATTGSSRTTTTVTVGERLPASVEITEFPDEVYREVPAVRSYRYYSSDRGIYLVDPSDRTVIEEID